jgi:hypothetical protein
MAEWECQVTALDFGMQGPKWKVSWPRWKRRREAGGYGASLKDDYRYFYGAHFGMSGRGEAIAS